MDHFSTTSHFDEQGEGKETIVLYPPTFFVGCIEEIFENHLLLHDGIIDEHNNTDCQRVIQYYLANGYDLVDKYDKKVELIKKE